MINGVQGADPARRERLIKVLDIDPEWRMHQARGGVWVVVVVCLLLGGGLDIDSEWRMHQARVVACTCARVLLGLGRP